MKKVSMARKAIFLMILSGLFLPRILKAQSESQERIMDDSKKAKASFLKSDPSMENLFKHSAGYVIFPNVGKGAIGVGGASGRGTVYDKGMVVGTAQMTQVTVGAQVGGQAYREVIFFENRDALDRWNFSRVVNVSLPVLLDACRAALRLALALSLAGRNSRGSQ